MFILAKAKDQSGAYIIDKTIDFIAAQELTDLAHLFELKIASIQETLTKAKPVFDELNSHVIAIFGNEHDLRKKILYGNFIDEPYYDSNGTHDLNVPLRSALYYASNEYEKNLLEEKNNGSFYSTLPFIDTLLNPQCANHSMVNSCIPSNIHYLTSEMFDVRKNLFNQLNLPTGSVRYQKDMLDHALYDQQNNSHTYLISNFHHSLLPILKILHSDNDYQVTNQSIKLFEPNKPGRYLLQQLELGYNYDAFDLWQDGFTLMNTKVFREYGYSGTIWWRTSDLVSQFVNLAYDQKNFSFKMNQQHFNHFNGLFK